MLIRIIRTAVVWMRRAITQPLQELSRWQRAARFAYDLGRHGARQLREDRASQMAAALAFRTLFGFTPVVVVATVFVRAFRGPEAMSQSLEQILIAMGLDKIHLANADEQLSLAQWIKDLTDQLSHINLSAIGWVGTAVITYAAISLMVTIEKSFNIIYRAPEGRSWSRRIPLYWFVVTISPLVIVLTAYVNNRFDIWIESVHAGHWILWTIRSLWSFGLVWLLMFMIYNLVPSANVEFRPALAGSFVASVLLILGKHTLATYLGHAFSLNQLYGTLGLVPLFMYWVYLMWLAVLFGLQVAATLQMLHGRSLDDFQATDFRTGLVDPACILGVMKYIERRFRSNQMPVTIRQIAEAMSIPHATVEQLLKALIDRGVLLRVEHADMAVTLAKPPELIDAAQLLEIGQRATEGHWEQYCPEFSRRLRTVQRSLLDGATLASICV